MSYTSLGTAGNIPYIEGAITMTDDLEKQADETEPEAEPAPVEEPQDGEAGSADTESGVEPESQAG